MAIETRKKTIGEHEVAVTQLPARRAIKLKIRLINIFGPAIGELLGSVENVKGSTLMDADINGSTLSAGFTQLAKAVDPDLMVALMEQLFQAVRIDGKEFNWEIADMEFAGDLGRLYEIAFFVLRVNFESFFVNGRIGTILSSLTAAGSTPTSAPESNE